MCETHYILCNKLIRLRDEGPLSNIRSAWKDKVMRWWSLLFLGVVGTSVSHGYGKLAPYVDTTSASCPEVDLNKDKNSPFNKIPMYDQDGSNLCYAYAASEMVDYYRIKKGDTSYDLTNPVYAGWATYYKNKTIKDSSLDDGGRANDVIAALREEGVCSDKEVKQKLSQLTSSGASEPEILGFLEVVYKNYGGMFADKNWVKTYGEVSQRMSMDCDRQENLKATLEKKGLFSVAPTVVLSKTFTGCKSNPVKIPELEMFTVGSDGDMGKAMDKALKGGMPAEVNLCSGFFDDPNSRGLRGGIAGMAPRSWITNIKKDCGSHAVVVSGRMNINGSCNYLVRNSYGAFWKPDGATACACKTRSGEYKQLCTDPNEVAEYVGCWFDSKNLLPNVGGVGVFK